MSAPRPVYPFGVRWLFAIAAIICGVVVLIKASGQSALVATGVGLIAAGVGLVTA